MKHYVPYPEFAPLKEGEDHRHYADEQIAFCGAKFLSRNEFKTTHSFSEVDCLECNKKYKLRFYTWKLSDYLKEVLPEVNFETAKSIISAYRDFEFNVRGRHCDICLKELTNEELNMVNPYDFLICCTEHKKYSLHFQVDMVRRELGINVKELPFYE